MLSFMLDREEMGKILRGRRYDAVVPLREGQSIAVGDQVELVEAFLGAGFVPEPVPDGQRVTVVVTRTYDQEYKWQGQDLHYLAWDPEPFRAGSSGGK